MKMGIINYFRNKMLERKYKKVTIDISIIGAWVFPSGKKINYIDHPELLSYPQGVYIGYLNENKKYVWLKVRK